MNVKCFKLVTGEDIMAEFEEFSDRFIWKNPVQISMMPSRSSTTPTFGFMPFPVYSGQNSKTVLTISKDHIIFDSEADEQFLQQYDSIFGSGIITPSKNIVI